MDLDAFSAVHGTDWARLDTLARRRRLTGAESDELVRLYQEVATHLSQVRSAAPDPVVVSRLSDILARGRSSIAGAHDPAWRDVRRFVELSLPAAFYRLRWWTLGVTLATILVAVVAGFYVVANPEAQATVGTPAELRTYAEDQFTQYYSNYPGTSFFAQVWTHNALIATLCVAFGITGIVPVWVIVQNAVGVGVAAAIMHLNGGLGIFFQMILPHGLLELTAVFVAAAAGLRIFWTLVDPGGRPRGRALSEEGLALFTTTIGLTGVLAVSGLLEGFLTPSSLPWAVKVAIGALVLVAFWVYVLVLGRRAVRAGATGGLVAAEASAVVPLAA